MGHAGHACSLSCMCSLCWTNHLRAWVFVSGRHSPYRSAATPCWAAGHLAHDAQASGLAKPCTVNHSTYHSHIAIISAHHFRPSCCLSVKELTHGKELSDALHHHCFATRKASSGFTVGRPLALPAFARLLDILQVSLTGLSDYCRSL